MPPKVGVGGGIPSPRKLNVASVMIIWPRVSVIVTNTSPTTCGAIWRTNIRSTEHPILRAASTKSISLSLNTSPLTNFANVTHPVSPSIKAMLTKPGPMAATMVMATTTKGRDSSASTVRIMTASTSPPRNPATRPSAVPMRQAMSTDKPPTMSEIRVANRSRAKRSRPRESVPKSAGSPFCS